MQNLQFLRELGRNASCCGWPSLTPEDMIPFPEPKHVGAIVEPSGSLEKAREIVAGQKDTLTRPPLCQDRIVGVIELLGFSGEPETNVVKFVESGVTKWITFLIEKLSMERVISEVQNMKANHIEETVLSGGDESMTGLRLNMTGALNDEYGQNELLNQQRMSLTILIYSR